MSMLHGWWRLIRYQTRRPSIGEDFFVVNSPQRKSFGKPLESEKLRHNIDESADEPVTPGVPTRISNAITTIPEAGDVGTRHETTDLFDGQREGERRSGGGVDGVGVAS